MPPRWPRKPDRNDPEYRRLDDIMNFAINVALFAAVNSGLWFVDIIKHNHWSWRLWFTGAWLAILILHFVYIKAIANYSSVNSNG